MRQSTAAPADLCPVWLDGERIILYLVTFAHVWLAGAALAGVGLLEKPLNAQRVCTAHEWGGAAGGSKLHAVVNVCWVGDDRVKDVKEAVTRQYGVDKEGVGIRDDGQHDIRRGSRSMQRGCACDVL